VYCLRNKARNEVFKIQADFGGDTKFPFKIHVSFDETSSYGPFVYGLDLNLEIDDSDQFMVEYDGHFKPIQDYSLRISSPGTFLTEHYHDKKRRVLLDPRHTLRCFLFDVQFSRSHFYEPPGKNS